jgi:DNA polymerase-1
VSGGDVHHFAAETLFGEPMPEKFDEHGKETAEYKRRRALAKIINFGILYGMGPKKLAQQMEISPERAKQFYDNYMAGFPGIRKFMQRVSDVADSRLYISSAYGRRFRFHLITDEDRSRGWIQASGKGRIYLRPGMRAVTHKALNYLIQGSCADLSRRSMVRIDEVLRDRKTMMVNQVHDEMLFEVHNDEREEVLPLIRQAMSDWPQFKLPFTSTEKHSEWSWAEAKEL